MQSDCCPSPLLWPAGAGDGVAGLKSEGISIRCSERPARSHCGRQSGGLNDKYPGGNPGTPFSLLSSQELLSWSEDVEVSS